MGLFMTYKVHWLIDGLIEVEADDIDMAVGSLVSELGLESSDGAGLREKLRTTLADWSSK